MNFIIITIEHNQLITDSNKRKSQIYTPHTVESSKGLTLHSTKAFTCCQMIESKVNLELWCVCVCLFYEWYFFDLANCKIAKSAFLYALIFIF